MCFSFIEIAGWIKMLFVETKTRTGDAMYSLGAISDGVDTKMAVRVISPASLPTNLFVGCPVMVSGLMQYDGICPYIKVSKGLDIKIRKADSMDPDGLMDAAAIPKKVKAN